MAWRFNDLTLAAGAPPAHPGSSLDGYQTTSPNQQHVNYIGTDNQVHELVYDGAWNHHDLTAETNAPLAIIGSPLDGYTTASPSQQHVNYIGTDGHVHELVYDGVWTHHDLTAETNAPLAESGSGLDGYVTTSPNQQHVNYIGIDRHVHELVYDGSWTHHDLTAETNAPLVVSTGSPLDGYITTSPNQQHVNYIGVDNHVHALVYDGSWTHHDLSAETGAPPAADGSALDGYTSPGQQHVNYIGTDNHVHEVVYKGGAWVHADLTFEASAPPAARGSTLDGYITSGQQHVNYIGTDRQVHELVYKGDWSHADLTALSGAPAVSLGSGLDGYVTTSPGQQHVNYIGAVDHVLKLMYPLND